MTVMGYSGGPSGACTCSVCASWLTSRPIFVSGVTGSSSVSSIAWNLWGGSCGAYFFAITSIPIHYCDIGVSNRMTSTVCEDKLIWFIAGYLVDASYDSVGH